MEKYRSAGVVSGQAVVGDVNGKAAIIIDDLISSGTTLTRAAEACRARGALSVAAAATHGVFNNKASASLSNPALNSLTITNSVPATRVDLTGIQGKLSILDITGLFANVIGRIHSGESVINLLEDQS
jgi:ribose-phosphate pyrophosphokinase